MEYNISIILFVIKWNILLNYLNKIILLSELIILISFIILINKVKIIDYSNKFKNISIKFLIIRSFNFQNNNLIIDFILYHI